MIGLSYAFCNLTQLPSGDITSNVSYIDFRSTGPTCPYNSNKTSIQSSKNPLKVESGHSTPLSTLIFEIFPLFFHFQIMPSAKKGNLI